MPYNRAWTRCLRLPSTGRTYALQHELALRIRMALEGQDGLVEKQMFGGICFMLNGNMCCGVTNDDMMVRVGPGGVVPLDRQLVERGGFEKRQLRDSPPRICGDSPSVNIAAMAIVGTCGLGVRHGF